MSIKMHLLLLLLFFPLVYFYFSFWGAIAYLITGILLDSDHVLWYMVTFRENNPIKAVAEFKKAFFVDKIYEKKALLGIFHTIEFYAVISLLTYGFRPLLPIFWAVTLHIVMDIIADIKTYYSMHKVFRPYSILVYLIRDFI